MSGGRAGALTRTGESRRGYLRETLPACSTQYMSKHATTTERTTTMDTTTANRALQWVYDDGGRAAAGYRGDTGDCACRSIAIVTGMTYAEVYDLLIEYAARERPSASKKRSHPRTGVHTPTLRRVMDDLGWTWQPTMSIGSGTTVHVREGELPGSGRLLLSLSRHLAAVVDGVVHDTYDPSREGTRAVYGYWHPNG